MRRGQALFEPRGMQYAALNVYLRHSTSPQASDTRNPCRNIRSSRHRSRAALRLSLAASRSFSTSAKTWCLRSPIILSNVRLSENPATPALTWGTLSDMRLLGSFYLVLNDQVFCS